MRLVRWILCVRASNASCLQVSLTAGSSAKHGWHPRRASENSDRFAAMTTHKDAVAFDKVLPPRHAVTLFDLVIVATVHLA
jgi:hypothetical protein